MEDNTQNNQEIKTEIIEQIKTNTTTKNEENNLKEWQDEEKKENNNLKKKKKKALPVTLNKYIKKLKELNCEIHKNKEEIEKYLNYSISNTFYYISCYLQKFDTFYEFDDLFKLNVKNSMFATRAAINDSINILKTKEKKILKINNNILSFLAEKAKSSSDEFKFKKLHEIIKKIKEKQTYLNEIKNFIKVLFKRNENENNLEKSSEIEILSLKELKDVLSYLEKNFKNFKETSKDSKYKEEEDKFLDDYLKTYYILIKKLYAITLLIKDIENIENDYSQHYVKLKKKNLKKLINFFLDFYFKINSIIENKIKEKNSLIKNYKKLNVKYLI